ncbi:hypothetical protein NX871_32280, partial [Burkholderia thailandensis]|uniref:hypothetical protein n=1 Tax=Burkholderia thailandensis TaxID=57975 RepID=UPI00217ED5C2
SKKYVSGVHGVSDAVPPNCKTSHRFRPWLVFFRPSLAAAWRATGVVRTSPDSAIDDEPRVGRLSGTWASCRTRQAVGA